MHRLLSNFCVPRTPLTIMLAKYMVPTTVLSILCGVAISAFLIIELQTNEQLWSLNAKLKTLQIDVDSKQQIVDQLRMFNEDLTNNVHAYDKDFAQIEEGAVVETLYGKEMTHKWSVVRDLNRLLELQSSCACNLLSFSLDPDKYLQFQGDHAGVVIRLSAPVAIHTIQYDHWIADYRDDRFVTATPKKMNFYVTDFNTKLLFVLNLPFKSPFQGIKNHTRHPIHLGQSTLQINRRTHHQQIVLHLEPKDFYQHIRFDIVSNHGHPDHTIAYKLSVFGYQKPD